MTRKKSKKKKKSNPSCISRQHPFIVFLKHNKTPCCKADNFLKSIDPPVWICKKCNKKHTLTDEGKIKFGIGAGDEKNP